jgi:hypothetical protein
MSDEGTVALINPTSAKEIELQPTTKLYQMKH